MTKTALELAFTSPKFCSTPAGGGLIHCVRFQVHQAHIHVLSLVKIGFRLWDPKVPKPGPCNSTSASRCLYKTIAGKEEVVPFERNMASFKCNDTWKLCFSYAIPV
ncbi:hypothetical protein AVEN_189088-1 [Araneus ventricosus]|uniref:Uncharacterized protein n=1 Tax=Araneus ventricosus TaxID=182803 RepID=A0A4Y2TCR7_ARAVE|nr:hypothetical protein AVEN_189088-1 [Araneus ventricosus]